MLLFSGWEILCCSFLALLSGGAEIFQLHAIYTFFGAETSKLDRALHPFGPYESLVCSLQRGFWRWDQLGSVHHWMLLLAQHQSSISELKSALCTASWQHFGPWSQHVHNGSIDYFVSYIWVYVHGASLDSFGTSICTLNRICDCYMLKTKQ